MSSFEVEKTLVSSTRHISYTDIDKIKDDCTPGLMVSEYDYGLVIHFDSEFELSDLGGLDLSDGLLCLCVFTLSNGCANLKLDQDGPIYEEFPNYDW
jgi:hypothetical protein